MKIERHEITVAELAEGYVDNGEEGVFGYGGKLNIRPKYQREFIYNPKERDLVIDSVTENFPLNTMYWSVCEDGTYEVIDGQQRTISLCRYVVDKVVGRFAYKDLYFDNLTEERQKQILNYPLMVYLCSGTEDEKLAWFRIINIAGKKLSPQEMRNAVYAGSWTENAKRYFSKTGCVAHKLAQDYMDRRAIRQEYLETAIDWISEGRIEAYMNEHKKDANAAALWRYFQDVITWVQTTFTVQRDAMKHVPWGRLYNEYKDAVYDANDIEKQTAELISNCEDVTKQSGIYHYILSGDKRYLSARSFTLSIKQRVYEQQEGICPHCEARGNGNKYEIGEMEADHVKPWWEGGRTVEENCQLLCKEDNRRKAGK